MDETVVTTAEKTIRAVAPGLFDVTDEHPCVGSALTGSPGLSPIARSVARQIRDHDDRVDFLSGIDLILTGITSRGAAHCAPRSREIK